MPTYAVGDIQGCHRSFLALLERIDFTAEDALWLAGDLVNRGPRSLDVLRWASERGESVVSVLGNHDLNLLAVALGVRRTRKADTLAGVLDAPDREAMLAWLLARPLLHRDRGTVLVHAGLLPQWTVDDAEAEARAAETALRADPRRVLRDAFEGPRVDGWRAGLSSRERVGLVLDVFTQLRLLNADGSMDRTYQGRPDEPLSPGVPWFKAPHRRGADTLVLFGHWSSLGYHEAPGAVCLDSGCVWGKSLTAFRIEDRTVFSQPNQD